VIFLTGIAPEYVGWYILKVEGKLRDDGSILSLNICESRVQGTASRPENLANPQNSCSEVTNLRALEAKVGCERAIGPSQRAQRVGALN